MMSKSISPSQVLLAIVVLCSEILFTESQKIPSWAQSCPLKGPLQLDNCIVKRLSDALPFVLKGYPKYRVPQLEPLRISNINVDTGSKTVGLSLKMADVDIWNLKQMKFAKSKMNMANRNLELTMTIPRVEILSQYIMDGKVLILPIKGDGDGNITMESFTGVYKFSWDYNKKNGKQYARINKSSLTFTTGRAHFHFKNLFGGEKHLGDHMNMFLNDSWEEVIKEYGPAVAEAFNLVFREIIQNVVDLVPFAAFFPPGEK